MHVMTGKMRLGASLLLGLLSSAVAAQGRTLTAADYARAERFMAYSTTPLVDHAVTTVHWLDDGHFWYLDHDAHGDHFMRMDVAGGKATPLFDQRKLAAAAARSHT